MVEGVGGLEAHVLHTLDMGTPAERFGRIHHLPAVQLGAVTDGMRNRGLIGADGWLSERRGRAVEQRVEALTDELATAPYDALEAHERNDLEAALEPLAELLRKAQPWESRLLPNAGSVMATRPGALPCRQPRDRWRRRVPLGEPSRDRRLCW